MKNSMKRHFKIMLPLLVCTVIFMGCEGEGMEPQSTTENSRYDIASNEYVDLALQGFDHLSDFNIDTWGMMLADDVEYYFPDGDSGTRTVLNGKTEVVNWWNNWVASSGIESMTITKPDLMPIRVNNDALSYSGLTGVFVISYFSNKLVFDNGNTVDLRMNFALHFNEDSLIDRYYTYYDRAPIIEAMDENILDTE